MKHLVKDHVEGMKMCVLAERVPFPVSLIIASGVILSKLHIMVFTKFAKTKLDQKIVRSNQY